MVEGEGGGAWAEGGAAVGHSFSHFLRVVGVAQARGTIGEESGGLC